MYVRAATGDDLAAIAELFGSVEEAAYGRPSRVDAEAVKGWMVSVPLETNTWLIEEDGALVAGAFARCVAGRGALAGAVRPAERSRGLGTRVADFAEARLAEEGAERLHAWTIAGDDGADALFRARGYREVRRFWDMAIELEDDLLEADLPEAAGEIEVFREADAHAFYTALEEAFEDHWEHQRESFDEWWPRQQAREAYDPSLWFLIRDGDQVAAVVRNDGQRMGGGFVAALGVRKPWRGRGYGRSLLLHSFREFRRRGQTRASLTVDAANASGATRLYESVGMEVETENVVWEKQSAQ
jgi:mycothiol synthase